jgi:hypothetical protein
MIGFLKSLFRGYRGGPNFDLIKNHQLSLGDFTVTIDVPHSFPQVQTKPKIVNYPIEDESWFEKYYNQLLHRHYILLRQEYWFYYPLVPTPFRDELGSLFYDIALHKVSKNESGNILSPDELGQYLLLEYDNYHNAPEEGEDGSGWNSGIRNRIKKRSEERAFPFTPEELEEKARLEIKKYGWPDIENYSVVTINDKLWAHFKYKKNGDSYIYYSIALTRDYYLTVEFTLSTNMTDESYRWHKDALATSKELMKGLKFIDNT